MASIPIVSDLVDTMTALPAALLEIPEKQRKHREEILIAVTTLAEAVSQALNVVTARCGRLILQSGDLKQLKNQLVEAPLLLDDFRLNGVCTGLGKVRAELRTVLSLKGFSIRLFQRKQLERLLEQIQYKERDLEEDFDVFLRELSNRAPTLTKAGIPELNSYLRDCQAQFEEDVRVIRKAMRTLESRI
ncbi:MAG: hypothetical protein A3I66_03665 [Burkholderiales bacterium RIFCSPLOWO2_02_FULL_57_36]|nr:MAG: hypothetical protein A3I66_03665 [Burkholderiales bacterium RIFCSPLOWO2_02_FULL_57_36]